MKHIIIVSALLSAGLIIGCSDNNSKNPIPSPIDKNLATDKNQVNQTDTKKNVLLENWSGPFQGVPAFDKVTLADLKSALESAMTLKLAEIKVIAENPEPPTFSNTIIELERSGKALDRVLSYWGVWRSNLSTPEFRQIASQMAPVRSAFRSKIEQNDQLFQRVKTIYQGPEMAELNPHQQRLVYLKYNEFARNGVTLKGEKKARYIAINQRLAELYTQFSNNILADQENYVLYLNKDQLGGLPQSIINAAAAAAKERGQPEKFAITNTRSSMDPFLTYSNQRSLRQKVWETYYSRGDNGDQYDNNSLITEILQLRHERVKLLGYKNYASWRLEDRMAETPENALKLMQGVWKAAIARVKQEVADMQQIANTAGDAISIEPWDYRYYAEKVRQNKYQLDSDEIRQYLQLDKLREAMFYVAGKLFEFNFTEVEKDKIPVFHPDVRVWEVTDKSSGEHIGLWYLDPFARKGKRSGAWATSYRSHTTFDGKTNVLASNNSNFINSSTGEPVLISWDDAETYFHEFGHALHALSSKVAYPTLNSGVRDYTEFQSQLLERWLSTDAVINRFLLHHKTGKPMPAEMVNRIKRAATFNQGFKTTEYLASALIDMKLHTIDPEGIDPDKFELETLNALNMPKEVVMRHRTPHFGHIFSSEGYSASYYGYIWAEVLTSDASEAFISAPGGFYDEAVAQKLVDHLFSIRNAVDPGEAYRNFRGRDADINALMRDRGFPVVP